MAEWSKAAHLSCALFGGEGSNPSAVIFFVVLWRSWLAHRTYNAKVAGSRPAGTIYTLLSRESCLFLLCAHSNLLTFTFKRIKGAQ